MHLSRVYLKSILSLLPMEDMKLNLGRGDKPSDTPNWKKKYVSLECVLLAISVKTKFKKKKHLH